MTSKDLMLADLVVRLSLQKTAALASGVAKAVPAVAATGAVAYGANAALDDPIGKRMEARKRKHLARMARQRATWNPRTGVMY